MRGLLFAAVPLLLSFGIVGAAAVSACLSPEQRPAITAAATLACEGVLLAADAPGAEPLCASVAELVAALLTIQRATPAPSAVAGPMVPSASALRAEILRARAARAGAP